MKEKSISDFPFGKLKFDKRVTGKVENIYEVLFVRKRVSALFNIPELCYISDLLNAGKSLEHYCKHKGQKVAWHPCEVSGQDMALRPSHITVSFLGGQ